MNNTERASFIPSEAQEELMRQFDEKLANVKHEVQIEELPVERHEAYRAQTPASQPRLTPEEQIIMNNWC